MAEISIDRTTHSGTLAERLSAHREVAWQHGLVGGLVAGVIMGLFLTVTMAAGGDGFFRPLELIGSVWYGTFTTGAAVILIGLATHLAVAAFFGVIWSWAFSYVKVEPLISGVVYGAVLWGVMQYLVLPLASFMLGTSSGAERFNFDGRSISVFSGEVSRGFSLWMVLGAYLLFGLILGVFEEWADRRRARVE